MKCLQPWFTIKLEKDLIIERGAKVQLDLSFLMLVYETTKTIVL